ncbi:MAG: DASS family sodium-coupled anion symporter [Chlamydiota bacterium]|nr:DASS family sodium-coupled anion symporter [Chlamydiota bacterium]
MMHYLFNHPFAILLAGIVGGSIMWITPPEDVNPQAIPMLAIFVFTILGIILRAFPMGTIALFGLTLSLITGTLSFSQAFSGFSHEVVWLIVAAFFISRGFIKTGLGERIAYCLIHLFGKNSLGMSYGLLMSDLLLAPAIPSVTARVGGILFPIVRSLASAFGSEPHIHPQRLGAFLIKTTFQGSLITSSMFITAMAANPLIVSIASGYGLTITWGSWALAAAIPGGFALLILPLFLHRLAPPTIKKTPQVKKIAHQKLQMMGTLKKSEWIMIITFILLIILWAGYGTIIKPVVAAMVGLIILLATALLSWEDIIGEKGAWSTFIWFSVLITMAHYLTAFGLTSWFSHWVQEHILHYHWSIAFVLLTLIYCYSHYFFASIMAHISAMYPPFLLLMTGLGAPPLASALMLAFVSNLMGGLTHYASGPAPIFFGAGYLSVGDWWRLGLYSSLITLTIYLTIGSGWWYLLGIFQ